MRNRIERLRVWLLVGAGLLIVVLGVFIGSARYLRHRWLANLPSKLGVDIKSETNGFTYSQSVQGKTVYTIHAAREVEHTDGKITLHDVSVVLYGRGQDRADRIYGNEFEYDQKAGVLRAVGLVHIDMQAAAKPGQPFDAADPRHKDDPLDRSTLHATTSGLVYMQNLGLAATGQDIEFRLGQMTGHAHGADYNTDSGLLLLHSAVRATGTAGGRPLELTADTAQLDNRNRVAYLTHAGYSSLGQTIDAQQATLYTRPDGTVARVLAEGDVTGTESGERLVAQRADVLLNAKSQPQSAVLGGGLLYVADQPLRQSRAQADGATLAFDPQGVLHTAVFTGSVHMTERRRATEAAREPWSVRDLMAAKLDLAFAASASGKPQLRDADATGAAHLTVVDEGGVASPRDVARTELSGDDLRAHFRSHGDSSPQTEIETLAGRGHTLLRQVDGKGIEQTSAGDSLDAAFRTGAAVQNSASRRASGQRSAGVPSKAQNQLQSAVQEGHVEVVRRVPVAEKASRDKSDARRGQTSIPDEVQRALAQRAVYDGSTDRITLSGKVQLSDAGSVLWTDRLALDRMTGDAQADGSVTVDYQSPQDSNEHPDEGEPAHIRATRAELQRTTGVATFFATPGERVRLWQGGSQVQAPEMEFTQIERRLVARSLAGAGSPQVQTLLVSTPATAPPGGKTKPAQMVRILSHDLVYLDSTRTADFTGGVRVESVDGTMTAQTATVYLQQAAQTPVSGPRPASATTATPASPTQGPTIAGHVERVVAVGQVEVVQPGRRAAGDRLVYTASDGFFVLTGTPGFPAHVVDASREASITGAALRFHAGDDTVEALGAAPGQVAPALRVRSEARVKEIPDGTHRETKGKR